MNSLGGRDFFFLIKGGPIWFYLSLYLVSSFRLIFIKMLWNKKVAFTFQDMKCCFSISIMLWWEIKKDLLKNCQIGVVHEYNSGSFWIWHSTIFANSLPPSRVTCRHLDWTLCSRQLMNWPCIYPYNKYWTPSMC